jgi:hypothetical protein
MEEEAMRPLTLAAMALMASTLGTTLGTMLGMTFGTTLGASAADGPRPNLTTRACAERDLQYVILIERHGEAQDIPGEVLAQAFFTVMRARKACRQGREQDALAIYDSIKLVPTTTQ